MHGNCGFARVHAANAIHQSLARYIFQQIAFRAGLYSAVNVFVTIESCENDDPGFLVVSANGFDRVDTIELGIRRSSSVTSGRCSFQSSTASRPLLASPTTVMSALLRWIIETKPSRTTPWSSAIRTRMRVFGARVLEASRPAVLAVEAWRRFVLGFITPAPNSMAILP